MILRKVIPSLAVISMTAFAAIAAPVGPEEINLQDGAIAEPLTGSPGDAAEGRKIIANRGLGNCLACHAISEMSEHPFHGEVGPPLDGVADRWSEEELRAIVVNAKAIFTEETVMPGFYSLDVGKDVRKDLVGKTILTAEEVENVVAYLTTLKE